MTTAELLEELRQRGVIFAARGDQLAVRAPSGVMTAELRARLTAAKPEILSILTHEPDRSKPLRVVEFRLHEFELGEWAVVLWNHAGASFVDLQQRYGRRLAAARTRP